MIETHPALVQLNKQQNNSGILSAVDKHYLPLLSAILLGYALLQSIIITLWPLTHNEGVNLLVARFISKGHQPYIQIFTLDQPFFVELLGQLGSLGLTATGFKVVFMLFGLLLLVNVATITHQLLGKPAALAATLLLATATTFNAEAAGILAVIPAISIATLSIVFVTKYGVSHRLFWLVPAGISWSISFFVSMSVLSTGLVILLLLILLNSAVLDNGAIQLNWPAIVKAAGVWVATVIICAVAIFLTTPKTWIDILLADYFTIRANIPLDQTHNFTVIGQFLTFNLWLSLFSIYAVAQLFNKPNHPLWIIVIWFVLSFGWVMIQINPQLKDASILLPPMSIMAGRGLVDAGWRVAKHIRKNQGFLAKSRAAQAGFVVLLCGIFLLASWQRMSEFNLRDADTLDDLLQLQQRKEIAALIQQHTAPDNCVIIDDAALAVAANRLPTPQLASLPKERVLSGMLTNAQLAELIQAGQCTAVVLSKREYYEYFDGFGSWLDANYPNTDKHLRTRIYYR